MNKAEGHFHEALIPGSLDGLSVWGLRIAMARNGWESSLSLEERSGEVSLSVRFYRWDWHGRFVGGVQVSFGDFEKVSMTNDVAAKIRTAANKCLRAWMDYPESIPCYENGQLLDDWRRNSSLEKYAPFKIENYSEAIYPAHQLCDARDEGEQDIEERLEMARCGIRTEDEITYVGWTSDKQKTDRQWGWTLRVTPTTWGGTKIMPHRLDFHTQTLIESVIADIVKQTHRIVVRLQGEGKMLPGMQTIEEYVLARELKERQQEEQIIEMERSDHTGDISHAVEYVQAKRQERWKDSKTLQRLLPDPAVEDGAYTRDLRIKSNHA